MDDSYFSQKLYEWSLNKWPECAEYKDSEKGLEYKFAQNLTRETGINFRTLYYWLSVKGKEVRSSKNLEVLLDYLDESFENMVWGKGSSVSENKELIERLNERIKKQDNKIERLEYDVNQYTIFPMNED